MSEQHVNDLLLPRFRAEQADAVCEADQFAKDIKKPRDIWLHCNTINEAIASHWKRLVESVFLRAYE